MASNIKSIAEKVLLQELEDDPGSFSSAHGILINEGFNLLSAAAAAAACPDEETRPISRFVEETVPRYSDKQFQEHFRMSPMMFEKLCEWIAPSMPKDRTISLEKKVLSTLWMLGNRESFQGIGDRFGLHKGSLHRCFYIVCQTLTDLRCELIHWPSPENYPSIAENFSERCGMQGVIGIIDGIHIRIPKLPGDIEAYINRKGYPSMQVQVVCDKSLSFIDVYTGWPGSTLDGHVFNNSPLKTGLESGLLPAKYHLLGDTAYNLSTYMLVPFPDDGRLVEVKKKFNRYHSSTRVEMGMAVRLLKSKFRRLKYLDMNKVETIPYIIFSAFVLHNFILKNSSDEDEVEDISVDTFEDPSDVNDDDENDIDMDSEATNDAISKRLEIAWSLK